MNKLLCILICIILSTSFLTSCASRDNDENIVRIVYNTSSANYIMLVIKEQRLIEKYMNNGTKIEWIDIDSAGDVRDAIVSGRADIGAGNYTTFISALDRDLPIVLVGNGYYVSGDIYSANPDIQSFEDFTKDSVIATPVLGSTYEFSIRLLSAKIFGDANYLNNSLVLVPDDIAWQAMISNPNDYDAAILRFPINMLAAEQPELHFVEALTDTMIENGLVGAVYANKDYYDKNPEIINAIREATEEAAAFINNDPEEAAQIIAKESGGEVSHTKEMLLTYPARSQVSATAYNRAASYLYENGFIDNPPTQFKDLPNYESIPRGD